jgi:hypothetical protein
MAGNHNIWQCRQTLKHIVLDDRRGSVGKEQRAFLLVRVDPEIRKVVSRLQRVDCSTRVYKRSPCRIDQHRSTFHERNRFAVDQMCRFGRERAV